MKQIILLVILIIEAGNYGIAQTFTNTTLPIVIISTEGGADIVDDPRVKATMKIIDRGNKARNYITDADSLNYLNYNGRIDIEIRGSSSQETEKKQYGFTTRKDDGITARNVKLLGMPEENDWILNSMTFDPALIRDFLCYNLSRNIGQYASRTAYCELMINDDYKGLYLLQEKIKADDHRVDVLKIVRTDNSYPFLTGGYITKADKTTGGDPVAWTMKSWVDADVNYIHSMPDPWEVTSQQTNYIYNQFKKLQVTASNNDNSVANGYPSVIDVPSFIDYMIISELGSNSDAYMYSTYFHKDRNGKLRAGPVWDNDLTFGNDLFFWGLDRSKTNIWQFSNGDNDGSTFWKDLYENAVFKCYLSKRWNELILPGKPLNPDSIKRFIDSTVVKISEAVNRNNQLYGNASSFSSRIFALKSWLDQRIPWITKQLGSYANCNQVTVPNLVISKIMYHPDTASIEFPNEDELEFLEVTNNGNENADLTGVYFSGTGLVYQFPNIGLAPGQNFVIASNSLMFQRKYNCLPNGEFTRHLSDKGENLILIDAFGNVIDEVMFTDSLPWPDADGNGNYLALNDADLDNNDPAHWSLSNEKIIVGNHPIESDNFLGLFPNPVRDILTIRFSEELISVRIYNMQGQPLVIKNPGSHQADIDLSNLDEGTYLVKIITASETFMKKIVRQNP